MADTTYEESRIETQEVDEIMGEVNEQLNETLKPWRDAIQKITRNNSIFSDAVKNKAMEIRLPRISNNRRNNNSPSPSPAGRRRRSSGGSKKMRKHKSRKHRTGKHRTRKHMYV